MLSGIKVTDAKEYQARGACSRPYRDLCRRDTWDVAVLAAAKYNGQENANGWSFRPQAEGIKIVKIGLLIESIGSTRGSVSVNPAR